MSKQSPNLDSHVIAGEADLLSETLISLFENQDHENAQNQYISEPSDQSQDQSIL